MKIEINIPDERIVEQVHDSFVNPEYVEGQTSQDRLKEVYNFLCENSIELEITKSYRMAFKAVKREYPVILDYMQGRNDDET